MWFEEECVCYLSLGLRPQEIWAEQIPPRYFHPTTRKTKTARVGGPGCSRADENARLALRAFGMTRG